LSCSVSLPQAAARAEMASSLAFVVAAVAIGRAAGESVEATEANWEKEVTKKVEAGGFAFVKFLAPW